MKKNPAKSHTVTRVAVKATPVRTIDAKEAKFREVVGLIQSVRARAMQAVNTELIELYWQVGEYISRKLETAAWGEGVVDQLARYIARHHPDIKGFTRRSLFRMRQFYDTYRREKKVAPLVRQLSWTHDLLILSKCKRAEEREFYLRLCARERWGKRELERQLNGALFERVVLSPAKVSPLVTQIHTAAETVFKDAYLLDFLDLPEGHSESDLQHGLVANLKKFLIELQETASAQAARVLSTGAADCGGQPSTAKAKTIEETTTMKTMHTNLADAALDGLRREVFQRQDAGRDEDAPGARLHLTDMVFAWGSKMNQPINQRKYTIMKTKITLAALSLALGLAGYALPAK